MRGYLCTWTLPGFAGTPGKWFFYFNGKGIMLVFLLEYLSLPFQTSFPCSWLICMVFCQKLASFIKKGTWMHKNLWMHSLSLIIKLKECILNEVIWPNIGWDKTGQRLGYNSCPIVPARGFGWPPHVGVYWELFRVMVVRFCKVAAYSGSRCRRREHTRSHLKLNETLSS